MTREVLPHTRRQGSGHLVQMSSVGGVVANPGHVACTTSKFALEGLAGEVSQWGIGVTIVEPGPFRTAFAGRSLAMPPAVPDSAGTAAGQLRARFGDQDGRQPNDPRRGAEIVLDAIDSPAPPLRLPLGPEAGARIRDPLTRQLAEVDAWQGTVSRTRFEVAEWAPTRGRAAGRGVLERSGARVLGAPWRGRSRCRAGHRSAPGHPWPPRRFAAPAPWPLPVGG